MTGFWDSTLVQIATVLVAAVLISFVAHHVTKHLVRQTVKRKRGETKLDEIKREDTLIAIVRTTISALVAVLTICAILDIIGVNVVTLLTGAGVIAVFVGLSVQNSVKDVLAGIFILLEEQYRVGDSISLHGGSTGDGASGTVEEITLRSTKLRDDSGHLITVPNGAPIVVTNKTASEKGRGVTAKQAAKSKTGPPVAKSKPKPA